MSKPCICGDSFEDHFKILKQVRGHCKADDCYCQLYRENVDWVEQRQHPLTQFERDFFKWMAEPFIFLDNPLYNMLKPSSRQSFDGGKKIVFPIKMG